MWSVWKRIEADSLVNSLNPHCVSLVEMPNKRVMISLKTDEMSFLYHFLQTLLYSCSQRCLLEPTTIAKGWPFALTIYSSLALTLSISEKVVAPSASTIRTYFPFATAIPALTAPPFPLFLGYSNTTKLRLRSSAVLRATFVVASLDPSLAIMIQQLIFIILR